MSGFPGSLNCQAASRHRRHPIRSPTIAHPHCPPTCGVSFCQENDRDPGVVGYPVFDRVGDVAHQWSENTPPGFCPVPQQVPQVPQKVACEDSHYCYQDPAASKGHGAPARGSAGKLPSMRPSLALGHPVSSRTTPTAGFGASWARCEPDSEGRRPAQCSTLWPPAHQKHRSLCLQ
jgi:hypothetical protein